MNAYWKLNTHGDPLATLSNFIQALWVSENLDVLIVAPDGHGHIMESPEEVARANPFHPMMEVNLARLVAETVRQRAGKKIGILLRACELRALKELGARGLFEMEDLLTICVDCLGTYPVDEVKWREERLSLTNDITDETLRFAPQGGIASYRYRPACQVCRNPGATAGMINLGVLGLPVRQEMLVHGRAEQVRLRQITDGLADDSLVLKREKMLVRIIERHQRTRATMIEDLESNLPGDIDALLDHLQACGGCHLCMDACPICSADAPRMADGNKFAREDVIHWLVSCAGCGMCEQTCPKELPLLAIFNRIRDQLALDLAN